MCATLTKCASPQAYIEGPYGTPMIDTFGDRHTCFIIVTSGMGWTFLRAMKRQLLADAARGRDVRVVRTVATMRAHDSFLVDEFGGFDTGIEGGVVPATVIAKVCTVTALICSLAQRRGLDARTRTSSRRWTAQCAASRPVSCRSHDHACTHASVCVI